MARRVRVPGLCAAGRVAAGRRSAPLRVVPLGDVSDGGDDLRQDAHPAHGVVHRLLAVRHPEGWGLGSEPAASAGDQLLPDGVGDAAPAALGAGAARSGAAHRPRGGRRDVHRRRGAGTAWRPPEGQEIAGGSSCGGSGAEGVRAVPDGDPARRVRRVAAPVPHRPRRAGDHGRHRRLAGLQRHRGPRLQPRTAQPARCPPARAGPVRDAARRAPDRVAGEAMAARHPPGLGRRGASAGLPRRVRVPLQPPHLPQPRARVPTRPRARCRPRAGPLPGPHRGPTTQAEPAGGPGRLGSPAVA